MNTETKHVLIVDDEDDFLETTSFFLRSKGFTVRLAHTGEEALDSITEQMPMLVFLDINMPVMDGVTTLEKLRATNKTLPVIMVTAAYNDERMTRCRELGISGFFPKKGTLEQLAQILEVSLRTHKKQ